MQKQVHCYWEKMLVAANIALFTDKQINKGRKYPGFVFFDFLKQRSKSFSQAGTIISPEKFASPELYYLLRKIHKEAITRMILRIISGYSLFF